MKPLPLLALLIAAGAAAAERPAFPPPAAGDRILVVAPHPDDGELCCAGYVQRALASGAQVSVVWMTAGDGFTMDAVVIEPHFREKGRGMLQLGRIRVSEAMAAARLEGVPLANLHMLGYPDGGLASLMAGHHDIPYRSAHTLQSHNPYGESPSFGKDYTGANLEADFAAVLDGFNPTRVFAPDAADLHPDHATTGEVVRRALAARGEQDRLFRYVIHAGSQWPAPRALRPELPLDPPPALAARPWQEFALTGAERDAKLAALRTHATQWRVMAPYLASFVRGNELFLRE